ncbi:MAG: ATP-binding protein [Spirochaetaceae bacterium]
MKQIVILSGKGGTGKTFVSASLASIADNSVSADCDVDAANLHILLKPEIKETHDFSGGRVAYISPDGCTGCGVCMEHCRFDALSWKNIRPDTVVSSKNPPLDKKSSAADKTVVEVDPIACEGCGVCGLVCPADAVSYRTSDAGQWYLSTTEFGPMVHAYLYAGEDNSGKLVQQVRERAKAEAEEKKCDFVLIDGPPGTGCPVMSAMTGVDYVVLVTEPTVAGAHDLKRVVELAGHFSIPVGMIVNKSTINLDGVEELRKFAEEKKIHYLGEIPYDKKVVDSVADLLPYAHTYDDEIAKELHNMWEKIQNAARLTYTTTKGEPHGGNAE